MGLQFKELVRGEEIAIKDLKGKVLAIDSHNYLYQFLTTIRSADGSVLTDRQGNTTSHLIGLFSRTTALMEEGLKLVFVFDGKAPEIKLKTWEKRTAVKAEAAIKLKEAEAAGDIGGMRKYAARTAVLTKEMLEDAKEVIRALGLPIVQAPSEGEAQTAHIVRRGDAYASVSQDYDNLIFGCPVLIKNLSIAGKRKKTGTLAFVTVKPEKIELQKVLDTLQLSLDQLIIVAILAGTDYNPGGVKGIGPKTALKLVKEHGTHFEKLMDSVGWNSHYPHLGWKTIFDTIKAIPVTDRYNLEWNPVNERKVNELLVTKHDFSAERVNTKLEALRKRNEQLQQKGLGSFL